MEKRINKLRQIDLDRLEFVPASEVPLGQRFREWDNIFSRVPARQALVLWEDQVAPIMVSQALYRRHLKGRFKHLKVHITRELGKRVAYVINLEGEGKE